MEDIIHQISDFMRHVGSGEIEVYNEFSLEHELGIFLREFIGCEYKVQFERPVEYFGLDRSCFVKREIDISIFTPDKRICRAIELKYPRAGQHPEQMFKACEDVAFLEQLVYNGFATCYFVILVEDSLFYRGKSVDGIFSHFRRGIPISGVIQKPTGKKDRFVKIFWLISG